MPAMKTYKVTYTRGAQGEYIYPASVAGVTWSNVHYHPAEAFMIGETDAELVADGKDVVLLTKKEATSALTQLRKMVPPPPKVDPLSIK